MAKAVAPPRRPTLEQVAAAAGVSRATVSRVVNDHASVDPDLRERVEKAVADLGYVPNQAARALMTRRTNTLALVASEPDLRVFGDPFFSGVMRGVSLEASAAGLQVMLMMAQSFPELDRIEGYLRSGPVDGVLLISEHAASDPLPAALREARIPFVIGGRPLQPDSPDAFVDNDNVGGGRLAAEHLRSRGHKVIGTVTGPLDMSAGIDRLQGFKAGLGRAFRAGRVEEGDFTHRGGEEAMSRLIERVPDLDAVFVASDLMALGALRSLRLAGRRVPEDVAVVGFDDIDAAELADPPLTTVRQQTVLQGRMMIRLFLARTQPDREQEPADGVPDATGADHLVLPVELVVRESSGPSGS